MAGTNKVEDRRAKFAAAQAELTLEQLEEQKKQNRTPSNPNWAATTVTMNQYAKRWFIEFLEDQHPDIDAEASYFKPGSRAPSQDLLKEYARYLARSREGFVAEKISARTIQIYIESLFIVLQHEAQHVSLGNLRRELYLFTRSNLVKEEDISTKSRPKPLVHGNDLTFIVSQLYNPEFLLRFKEMRTPLNLNLFMLLIVDLGGRGGEIAHNPKRPEHMCLCWQDVDFYTFQSVEDTKFDIRATVTIRWSKGQSLDESLYRKMPFSGLLPHQLALQDTLRQLLTLSLLDDVLEGTIKTWADLLRLRLPSEEAGSGRRIPIKQGMLRVPLLRVMRDSHLTTTPAKAPILGSLFTDLGRFCGFEHTMTPYALRRGLGYALDNGTTERNRAMIMGHTEGSQAFEHYRSKVATVDVPAMYRSLAPGSVIELSSVALNRSITAPTRPSEAAQAGVTSQEQYSVFNAQKAALEAAIREKYPSAQAAKRANDPLYDKYEKTIADRKRFRDVGLNKIYKSEYKQHFRDLTAQTPAVSQGVVNAKLKLISSSLILPATDVESAPLAGNGETVWGPIPDKACSDASTVVSGSNVTLPAELEKDSVQTMPSSLTPYTETEASPANIRLHGLSKHYTGKGKYTIKSKGISSYMDLRSEIKEQGENNEELFKVMERWYSVIHPLDEFPPGQEPLPGTYSCRFCGENLNSGDFASRRRNRTRHCQNCSQIDATARAQQLHDQLSPFDTPCSFQKRVRGGGRSPCGKVSSSVAEAGAHNKSHIAGMVCKEDGEKVRTCHFGSCGSSSEIDPPIFTSWAEQLAHVWREHRIWEPKSVAAVFCPFCHSWLIEPHEWKWHANDHLDDAQKIVLTIGYSGEFSHCRLIYPRICPFCYHDEARPVYERLYQTNFDFRHHLETHFIALKEGSERVLCPCYPFTCTKVEDMDVVELKEHLVNVHGIELVKPPKRLREEQSVMGATKRQREALAGVSNQNKPAGDGHSN